MPTIDVQSHAITSGLQIGSPHARPSPAAQCSPGSVQGPVRDAAMSSRCGAPTHIGQAIQEQARIGPKRRHAPSPSQGRRQDPPKPITFRPLVTRRTVIATRSPGINRRRQQGAHRPRSFAPRSKDQPLNLTIATQFELNRARSIRRGTEPPLVQRPGLPPIFSSDLFRTTIHCMTSLLRSRIRPNCTV